MTRTFLVALDLPDASDLSAIALDIEDSLLTDGLSVTSVKPWSAPNDPDVDFGFPELPQIPAPNYGP